MKVDGEAHSPLPWRHSHLTEGVVHDAGGHVVADCYRVNARCRANTALVIRAANAFGRLLDAVEALFPPDDWARYEGSPLAGAIQITLICTRDELLALRDAIRDAKA